METVSIMGVAGSFVGIIDVISRSLNCLLGIQTKYKRVSLTITLLIGQLSTLKAALNETSAWTNKNLVTAPQHERLVLDFQVSLDGCRVLMQILDERIVSLDKGELGYADCKKQDHVHLAGAGRQCLCQLSE